MVNFRVIQDGLRRINVGVVGNVGAGAIGVDLEVVDSGEAVVRRVVGPIWLFDLGR